MTFPFIVIASYKAQISLCYNFRSWFDNELQTAVESQTLRASKIQQRYKNPVFANFHTIGEAPK